MEKGINTKIVETKMGVVGVLNDSHLPVALLSLILEGLLGELKMQEQYALKQESEAYENALNEGKPNQESFPISNDVVAEEVKPQSKKHL